MRTFCAAFGAVLGVGLGILVLVVLGALLMSAVLS
jgi:hypothetical protein